jgi:membrane protein DedA with SNARE-associated domain
VEEQILDFVRQTYQALGWPGVVLLMAVESACIPLPSEIIMPLAGWMLVAEKGLGMLHLVLAGLYGAIGNVIGSVIAYAVGVWGGRPFLNRYGRYILISHHDIELAERWFNKYGEGIAFLSRLLPGVRTYISFPAGIGRMKMGKFLLYTFLGSFIWSTGLAYGGYVLGQNWEEISTVMRPFYIPILAAFLAAVIAFVWLRVRRMVGK